MHWTDVNNLIPIPRFCFYILNFFLSTSYFTCMCCDESLHALVVNLSHIVGPCLKSIPSFRPLYDELIITLYMYSWVVYFSYPIPLTDTTLTHSNLTTVLSHVVDIKNLMNCLNIPDSVVEKIREHSKDEDQQRDECIRYFQKYSPYSMWGWGYLGGELHYWGGEEAALTTAKAYIQRDPGNVHVHAWVWLCMY